MTTKEQVSGSSTALAETESQRSRQELEAQEKTELAAAGEEVLPGKTFVPLADIYETDEALFVVLEMPGVEREGLDVKLDQGVLSIGGRVGLSKYADLKPVYTEYNVGNFSRSFRLPSAVDAEAISATLADGVLTLELNKAKSALVKRIPIT